MVGTQGAKAEKVLRLAAMQPAGIHMVRELTPRESKNYLAAHGLLTAHDKAASLIEIVRRNFSAFESCVGEFSKKQPGRGQHGTLQREARIDVNRHFLNFLAAFRQFLDHTETRLKRDYADASQVFVAFRKRTSAAYDGVFAYRFLYKLRNFSQHCGAPVGVIDFESKAVGNSGMVMHTLHLLFDAEQLIRDGDDVWGPVRADLRKMGSRFPVDPLPRHVMGELEAIWEATRAAEKPFLEHSAQAVLATVVDTPRPNVTPAVIRLWHRKNSTTIEFINPPVAVMSWLGDSTFKELL